MKTTNMPFFQTTLQINCTKHYSQNITLPVYCGQNHCIKISKYLTNFVITCTDGISQYKVLKIQIKSLIICIPTSNVETLHGLTILTLFIVKQSLWC